MNGTKVTKWNQFLRSNWVAAICISGFFFFIEMAIETYGGMNLMESLFQTFFIESWRIWLAIGAGLAYLVIRRIVQLNKFLGAGLKFDKKLNEMEIKQRKFGSEYHNCLNGLSRRIGDIENMDK